MRVLQFRGYSFHESGSAENDQVPKLFYKGREGLKWPSFIKEPNPTRSSSCLKEPDLVRLWYQAPQSPADCGF